MVIIHEYEYMKIPKAIIFDLDGVIIDSEPVHEEAERIICKKYNIKTPRFNWKKNFKGKTAVDIFEYIIANFGSDDISIPEIVADYRKIFLALAKEKIQPIPGALQFIKGAKPHVNKIGLTTSNDKEAQQMAFDKFQLHDYFDAIITSNDISQGKPHPEPYIKTAAKLQILPQNCLVIEDSDNGIISARNAGCITVGLTTTFPREKLLEVGADYIVDSFEELSATLRSLRY